MSLGSLAFAGAWFRAGLPWPQCLFHQLTGLPCVMCGMTRCAIAFFHAHFAAAIRWNPLVFVLLCGLSIFDLYAFAVLVARSPRLRIRVSASGGRYVRGAVVGAFALNWIYLLVHWRNFA
jgi:hypothetical protein